MSRLWLRDRKFIAFSMNKTNQPTNKALSWLVVAYLGDGMRAETEALFGDTRTRHQEGGRKEGAAPRSACVSNIKDMIVTPVTCQQHSTEG